MSATAPEDVLEKHALLFVGGWLQQQGYRFTTVTPATHARVNARAASARATDLRDIFGWSRPFASGLLDARVLGWLEQADLLGSAGDGLLQIGDKKPGDHGERDFAVPNAQAND